MRKLLKFLVAAFALYQLAIVAMAFVPTKDPRALTPVDLIIVHGAGGEDNTLMDPSIDRAHKAAAAFHAGLAPKILFTGGRDKPENRAISEMMAEIAIADGVPETAVLTESKSQSTIQNLHFAREEIGAFPKRIALISTGFHLPRCWLSAKVVGANEVALLSANRIYHPAPNGIYILLRETIAWPVNLLRLALYKLGINSEWVYL